MRNLKITKTITEAESKSLDNWLNTSKEIIRQEIENHAFATQYPDVIKEVIAKMLNEDQQKELISEIIVGNKEVSKKTY